MKVEDRSALKQETSMPAQSRQNVQDEFHVEVNRMRNSLSALTLKHFMFDSGSNVEEIILEKKEPLQAIETSTEQNVENFAQLNKKEEVEEEPEVPKESIENQSSVIFRRSLSKHRHDPNRTHSKLIETGDIVKALTASQEKIEYEKLIRLDEKPRIDSKTVHFRTEEETNKAFKKPEQKAVHFNEVPNYKPRVLFKEPSRDSDEVASINNDLPWHKKHEYRTVTPFFKQKSQGKASSQDNIVTENLAFRPIETSRSTEDINLEILKPVPVFASKSYQELPTSRKFKSLGQFQTKSSEDLLFDNIDGIRKPESKRHKLMRIRSTSNSGLNRLSDQLIYENFYFDSSEVISSSSENIIRKKRPLPLPRIVDETSKRHSKTVVYVLDKALDEFVLEEPKDEDVKYEDVLLRNNVDRYSDATLFNSLLDSRDDCKFVL